MENKSNYFIEEGNFLAKMIEENNQNGILHFLNNYLGDINYFRNGYGNTLLMIAAQYGRITIFKQLLKRSDVNAINFNGENILMKILLHEVVQKRDTNVESYVQHIFKILIDRVDLNYRSNYGTALDYAILYSNNYFVDLLESKLYNLKKN